MRNSRSSSQCSAVKKEKTKTDEQHLWVDPELTFDRLPQPYRFINKILDGIVNKCLDCIRFPDAELIKVRNQELHLLQEKKATPCTATTVPNLENTDCGSISAITTDPSASYLFIGNTQGSIIMTSLTNQSITTSFQLHAPILILSCHWQTPINQDSFAGPSSLMLLVQTDQAIVCFLVTPPEESQVFHQVFLLELSQYPNSSLAVSKDGCYLSLVSQGSVSLYSIVPSTAKGNNPPPLITTITAPSFAHDNGIITFSPPTIISNTAVTPVLASSMTTLLKRWTEVTSVTAPAEKERQGPAGGNPQTKSRKSKTQPATLTKVGIIGFITPSMEVKVMWCYNDKMGHSMLLSWTGLNYLARVAVSTTPKLVQEWYLPTPLTCAGQDRTPSTCPYVESNSMIGTGHKEGAVMVWDLHTGAAIQSFSRHRTDITAIAFYKTNIAVTVDKEHLIKVHNVVSNTQLAHFASKIASPQAWMMSQDVPLIITRQGEDKMIVSNLQGGVLGRVVAEDDWYKIRIGDVDQSKALAVMSGYKLYVVGSVVIKKESKEDKGSQPKRKGKEGGMGKGKLSESPKTEVIETVVVYNLKDSSPLDLYASQYQ